MPNSSIYVILSLSPSVVRLLTMFNSFFYCTLSNFICFIVFNMKIFFLNNIFFYNVYIVLHLSFLFYVCTVLIHFITAVLQLSSSPQLTPFMKKRKNMWNPIRIYTQLKQKFDRLYSYYLQFCWFAIWYNLLSSILPEIWDKGRFLHKRLLSILQQKIFFLSM